MTNLPIRIPDTTTQKYARASNTLSREVKPNPRDRIEVEIGDSKQPDFKPQFKVIRWDNEVNFSLRAEEHANATVELDGEKIKYITPEYEVHQYDKPEAGEDGGLEFEWVLRRKPASNVLTATIQTKGLDFFYQPALTQAEIDKGAQRPENVVGSYAVYHKTKGGMNRADGKEYKVGKAFHIYRPKVTDASGKETWGELHIDTQLGLLTVTIGPSWLESAVYPVVADPTFGYTSAGGGSVNVSANNAVAFGATAPSDANGATLDKLTLRTNGAGGTRNTKGVLYTEDDPSSGNHGVAANGVGSIFSNSTTTDWKDSINGSHTLVGSEVYLLGQVSDGTVSVRADGGGRYYLDSSNSYASPGTLIDASSQNIIISIYATYTASGGGTAIKDLISMGIVAFAR